MYQLPSELWTGIFSIAVDHGSEQLPEQLIPLTHVCRYWRTALLSHPTIWSTLCMKPGNPSFISEWLARGQNAPRMRDLTIVYRLSEPLPVWDIGYDYGPGLLHRCFFRETLPNLQHLDFRATHVEFYVPMIPTPGSLFGKSLPRLKELKYLGATGGLLGKAENLDSCEIGRWSGPAGPADIFSEHLQTLLDNNNTLKSLTINQCKLITGDSWVPTATPMMEAKFLKIECHPDDHIRNLLDCIHAPQFKDLDTIHLSFVEESIRGVLSDGSGCAFEFSQPDSGRITRPAEAVGGGNHHPAFGPGSDPWNEGRAGAARMRRSGVARNSRLLPHGSGA